VVIPKGSRQEEEEVTSRAATNCVSKEKFEMTAEHWSWLDCPGPLYHECIVVIRVNVVFMAETSNLIKALRIIRVAWDLNTIDYQVRIPANRPRSAKSRWLRGQKERNEPLATYKQLL